MWCTHSRLKATPSSSGAAALPEDAVPDGMPLLMLPVMAPVRPPVMAPLRLPEPGPALPMPLGMPLPFAMASTDDRCLAEAAARRCDGTRGAHGELMAAALAMLLLQRAAPRTGRVVMARSQASNERFLAS